MRRSSLLRKAIRQIRLSSCTIHVLQNTVLFKNGIIKRSGELIVYIDYVIRNLLYIDVARNSAQHKLKPYGLSLNTCAKFTRAIYIQQLLIT